MISFYNVTKIYQPKTTALKDVTFKIKQGEFLSIVGRSGAGKSTVLKMLIGQEFPSKGKVFFDGQNISLIDTAYLPWLRRRIGTIFQDYKLFSSKTVFENLSYIMEVTGLPQKRIMQDVPEVLDIVDLAHRANHFPEELSGGEVQRTAIARALIHRPEVILADEPTGNLDPYHTKDIIELLLKINEVMGSIVILATHNKAIIESLGRRVLTLEDGRLVRDDETGKFVL